MSTRVLVCAATRAEHDACRRGIAASARPTDLELLLTGVGPLRAAHSLAARLAHGHLPLPELVVSSGFAGALSPTLAIASWITGIRVSEWNGLMRVPVEGVAIVEGPSDLERCDVLSSTAILTGISPAPPGSTPLVVDMESAALAREAGRRGIAFSVVRLISDTPSHPLPAFLSPLSSALSATSTASRLTHATRAVCRALVNPRAVARLMKESATWLTELELGWQRFAF